MCVYKSEYMCACICVWTPVCMCVCVHVATIMMPFSHHIFLLGWSCRYLHVTPAAATDDKLHFSCS